MPKYHFERSSTFRAFFQVGSSCWPLLKAEIELLPQPGFAAFLRGWFFGRMCVPTYAIGELVFVRDGYASISPRLTSVALMMGNRANSCSNKIHVSFVMISAFSQSLPGGLLPLPVLLPLLTVT
jgi:hypothetical protein